MAGPSLSQTQQQRMQLTLAPQLRQSLELLQVPVLELRALVQQEMEVNPTLEEASADTEPTTPATEVEENPAELTEQEASDQAEFDALVQLDDEWREYFSQNQTPYSKDDSARRQFVLDSMTQSISLQQHLMNQITLADLDDEEHRLAELVIGSLDDDGYLTTSVDELAASTGEDAQKLHDVLDVVKEFDPIGIGATDLSECLWLQLRRLGRAESAAAKIVRHHLDLLAAHKYQDIARLLNISAQDVEKEARLIATLEPKPGRRFESEATTYVEPEVSVIRNDDGDYIVLMNNDYVPHLHISEHYRTLMSDEKTPGEVKQYIRDKIKSSMFLIKSINQRQQTIYNIAAEIVRIQKEFLDNGVSHLRPLTMAEVATAVGVHETTVSRAIAGKYMQTPRGTYDMKYFFTPGYKTSDGKTVSNQTIKDAISHIVEQEDTADPLSDQDIVKKLAESGFNVARRTIAKYREELKILPSHLRKGFKTP
ncbi:MAG TPA: RNA polymerase factor sigma-54 [Kiritimatiellia bacterium]|nr:RNA polymerase factor sigma-54 [Kiritimatiellia bacterium]